VENGRKNHISGIAREMLIKGTKFEIFVISVKEIGEV